MESPGGGYEDDFDDFDEGSSPSPCRKGPAKANSQGEFRNGFDKCHDDSGDDAYEEDFDDDGGQEDLPSSDGQEDLRVNPSSKDQSKPKTASVSVGIKAASKTQARETSESELFAADAAASSSKATTSENCVAGAEEHSGREVESVSWVEADYERDIELGDRIGGGGFALVYKGIFRGRSVYQI